ncbi:MAG: hypothetical protein MMC33_004516 [Icmadophila ericetorum]|nr:hypothetical protein [Icmadophila ericetorum]
MAPEILHRVIHGSSNPSQAQINLLNIEPAILHDFRRCRVLDCDYPGIIPAKGSSVRGTYVTGLTDGDIWRLDIFEGDQYEKQTVKVKILNQIGDDESVGNVEGEEVEANSYVWADDEDYLDKKEWDYAEFRREKMMRHWVRRNSYDEVDEAVEAANGDPTGGRGHGGSITTELEKVAEEKRMKGLE